MGEGWCKGGGRNQTYQHSMGNIMDNMKRNRLIGSDHARRLYRHVTYGFSRQYASDDPLTFITYSPEDMEVEGLERLCGALGLIAVVHGRVELYGRHSALVGLLEDPRPILGRMVERAFWCNHVYPMADQTNIRLAKVRDRVTNSNMLKHMVSGNHPYLRNYYHETAAEIVLHKDVRRDMVKVIDGTVGCEVVHQTSPNLN